MLKEIKIKYIIMIMPSLLFSQKDSLSFNLNDLWNNVSWDTIAVINEIKGEVEQITTVAGVRGSEAKSEILKFLWYRKKAIRKNG